MKRWISVALWICLLLVVGAYGGVVWHLQTANDPVRNRLRNETPIAAMANSNRSRSNAGYAAQNRFSHPMAVAQVPQEDRRDNPHFGSELRFIGNVGGSVVPTAIGSDRNQASTATIGDVPTRFIANSQQPVTATGPNMIAQFFEEPTDAAPPTVFDYVVPNQRPPHSNVSHQESIPNFDRANPIRDPANRTTPRTAMNPMDGMKFAVLVGSVQENLALQVEQRMLGGTTMQLVEPSVSLSNAEIKIYAQTLSLRNDTSEEEAAPNRELPEPQSEEDATTATQATATQTTDEEDLEVDNESEAVNPAADPQIDFKLICDGPVVIVTPSGLIRGENLHYEKGRFNVGSAEITNPDTIITADDISFPFEIGDVRIIRLGQREEAEVAVNSNQAMPSRATDRRQTRPPAKFSPRPAESSKEPPPFYSDFGNQF